MLSTQAARVVAALGYTNVRVFVDGMPAWTAAGYKLVEDDNLPQVTIPTKSPTELESLLGEVTILDIRIPDLEKVGMIAGSIRIPLAELSERASEIPRNKPLVIVDHAEKQSLLAGRYLRSQGFERIHRLEGGLMKWVIQGYPVQR